MSSDFFLRRYNNITNNDHKTTVAHFSVVILVTIILMEELGEDIPHGVANKSKKGDEGYPPKSHLIYLD